MKNILLITIDSLRADYVFGEKAPNSLETLPRLTREGTRFTNGFSNAAYTKMSFLSILSGTYPWMFGSEEAGYDRNRPHLAELLSEAGYNTGGFHTNVYLSPTYQYDRGFDHYYGRDSDNTDTVQTSFEVWLNKLIERAVSTNGVSDVIHKAYESTGRHLGIQLGSNLYKPAEELNDAVVNWTQRCSQPAFIWVHYMDAHNPYYPHEDTVSEDISRRKAIKLFHKANQLGSSTPREHLELLERLYQGEITYLDSQIGDLLERLDKTLNLDNTVVALTSDHGEAFGENGNIFHPGDALYDENIHIPIILWGTNTSGKKVDTPVSNLDLAPTLLSIAGLEIPEPIVGNDLTTINSQTQENRLVFAEAFSREDGKAMVSDGKYKLIRDLSGGEEFLYDRSNMEKGIYGPSGEQSRIQNELSKELTDHIRKVNQYEGQKNDIEVTEDVRLQLRKLGYDE